MFLIRAWVPWVLVGFVAATTLAAQHTLSSPYREELASEIRGLTPTEIEDLREGRGMGLARAAELNGYPGPRHLLDAVQAGQIHLTPEQLSGVRQLFESMSREARQLGAAILTEERTLEAAFRSGTIEEADLRARLIRIAGLQGALRAIHMKTHLHTRALLNDHQIERYNQLRGHGPAGAGGHRKH